MSTQPPVSSDSKPFSKPDKTRSSLRSVILLLLILVGLYYGKPYLTGEQSIKSIDKLLAPSPSSDSLDPTIIEKPVLTIPRVSDKNLRALLTEFKERYEVMHSDQYLSTSLPEVVVIKRSETGDQLLIEIESKDPTSEKVMSRDIIFETDTFGRFFTTGTYSSIKLHPKSK